MITAHDKSRSGLLFPGTMEKDSDRGVLTVFTIHTIVLRSFAIRRSPTHVSNGIPRLV